MKLLHNLSPILLALCAAASHPAVAQESRPVPVALRFVAAEAHETGSSTSFLLKGGAADAALPLGRGWQAALEMAGSTIPRVPDTSRGLSVLTLTAGPRYTLPAGRVSFSGQVLVGAARGFDADFLGGVRGADTATAFALAAGGFVDVRLTRSIALRAAQADYLRTSLPNEADNRQGGVRVGAGVVFLVRVPGRR